MIVTVHADFIETHTPFSSNFFLNSTAFIPVILKFNINGFSLPTVFITNRALLNM